MIMLVNILVSILFLNSSAIDFVCFRACRIKKMRR